MNHLETALDGDGFVVTSELTPPKGTSLDSLLERARMLSGHVDAFNITDSHAARMAMAPMAVSHPADRPRGGADHADHEPRPEPDRDSGGSARGLGSGGAEHRLHGRRSSEERGSSRCKGRLRRRIRVDHSRRRGHETRSRHGRQCPGRRAGLLHRRRGQPRSEGSRQGDRTNGREVRSRCEVLPDPGDLRPGRIRAVREARRLARCGTCSPGSSR